MKFDYKAYERLFPREEAEKIRAELRKEQEQGNVLEEAEKPQASGSSRTYREKSGYQLCCYQR